MHHSSSPLKTSFVYSMLTPAVQTPAMVASSPVNCTSQRCTPSVRLQPMTAAALVQESPLVLLATTGLRDRSEGLRQLDGTALAPWPEVAPHILCPHSVNDRPPRQVIHLLIELSPLSATNGHVLHIPPRTVHALDYICHNGQGGGIGRLPCEHHIGALHVALRTLRCPRAASRTKARDGAEERIDRDAVVDQGRPPPSALAPESAALQRAGQPPQRFAASQYPEFHKSLAPHQMRHSSPALLQSPRPRPRLPSQQLPLLLQQPWRPRPLPGVGRVAPHRQL